MTELITVAIVAVIVIMSLVVTLAIILRDWKEDRRDMLNRIMARDYREFAEAETKTETIKVVTLDELRKELNEDRGEPLGMPV